MCVSVELCEYISTLFAFILYAESVILGSDTAFINMLCKYA